MLLFDSIALWWRKRNTLKGPTPNCLKGPMSQPASLAIIDAAITHRSELPMQNIKLKAKLHLALPPHRLLGHKTPIPCSGRQNNARSHWCKTKAKPHSALSPQCLPGHKKPMSCSGHQNVECSEWPMPKPNAYALPKHGSIQIRNFDTNTPNRSESPMPQIALLGNNLLF